MGNKTKQLKPPKEKDKVYDLPYDEIRKLIVETPTLTSAETLTRLNMNQNKSNLVKMGKFLNKIKGDEKNLGKPSHLTSTKDNPPVLEGEEETMLYSGVTGVTRVAPMFSPSRSDVETILGDVKTHILTAQVEGIARKVILNPRIYMWHTFMVGKGFDGDIADLINDAIEDFFSSRGYVFKVSKERRI